MRRVIELAGIAAFAVVGAAAAADAPPQRYDAIVDAVVARYQLPGIAVGVIDDGKEVYTATRGERRVGSGEAIDRDTLFKIASNTKAMTATVLARLVQQGRLAWDDPVRKHLPGFAMHDPWVSAHMQVGDLLVHHSGLPEGGGDLMLWPTPNRFTRADVIAGLKYLKPAYDFRAGYAYDNLLYVVAGELAARAGGAPYASLVRREIFRPLGMRRCEVGAWNRDAVGNVADPHVRRGDRFVVGDADGDEVLPTTMEAAGGVRCSLGAMLKWAENWLAPSADELVWLTPRERQKEWTPYTPMPIPARLRRWDGTRLYAYGYGWRIADMDGEITVSHTGTLSGMYSAMYLLPDRRSGFVVLINADAAAARKVLIEALLKQFTAPEKARSVAALADDLARRQAQRRKARVPDTRARTPARARDLKAILGVWRDPWFGRIRLCATAGGVYFAAVKSPQIEGPVMRVGDRYLIAFAHGDAEAWLRLPEHPGASLKMAKVDPDADFSYDYEDLDFSRLGSCAATVPLSPATSASAARLVDIRALVPDVAEDIKYAGPDNFTGHRVDGYAAAKCLLLAPVARALAKVERALRAKDLRLKLFDCYRPARAVAAFMRWARAPDDPRSKAAHYPNVAKADLVGDYIAPVSGHSRGATVDLTMLHCDRGGRGCAALDMGTPFDWFGPRAHTESAAVNAGQRANRERLRAAMAQAGFVNYPKEWWHYTLKPEPSPRRMFDVVIH